MGDMSVVIRVIKLQHSTPWRPAHDKGAGSWVTGQARGEVASTGSTSSCDRELRDQ